NIGLVAHPARQQPLARSRRADDGGCSGAEGRAQGARSMSALAASTARAVRRLGFGIAVPFLLLPIAHGLPPTEIGDPLTIRRVVLPPERIPQEIARVRQGILRQMPRDEFEELVAR